MLNIAQFLNETDKIIYEKYKNKIPFQVVEFANEVGLEVFEDKLADNVSGKLEKI